MKFNVRYLGIEHPQYFQGVTVGGYETVSVGIGFTPMEAFEDAVEGLVQQGFDISDRTFDEMKKDFLHRCHDDCEPPEEFYHHVSVHYTP